MNSTRCFVLALLMTALAFTSGCIVIGNRPPPPVSASPGVTIGQQLVDLKMAYEAGALSEEEFQQQRTRLLAGK